MDRNTGGGPTTTPPRSIAALRQTDLRDYEYYGTVALVGIACALAVLAGVYGDGVQMWLWGLLTLQAVGFLAVRHRLAAGVSLAVGHGCAIVAAYAITVVLPPDPTSPVALVPLGVTAFLTATSLGRALAVAAAIVSAQFVVPALGLPMGLPTAVPQWQLILAVLAPMTLGTGAAVRRQRRGHARAIREQERASGQLAETRNELEARRTEIAAANAAIERESAALAAQLARQRERAGHLAARRADEADLVQAIHHDLREPLRSIVSFAQLTRRRVAGTPEEPEVAELLDYAIDGGTRMTGMLNDLLTYARHDRAEVPERVDLAALVEEVRRDLAHQIERTGAQLRCGPLPEVRGYRTQLRQLVLNIVSNALKFARPGVPPRVEIRGRALDAAGGAEARYGIEFADNGRGIPADRLGEVFGLFSRAHAAEGVEGSGVGLALCRRIAIAHRAELTAASTPGEGTCLRLALPADAIARAPAPERGVKPVPA